MKDLYTAVAKNDYRKELTLNKELIEKFFRANYYADEGSHGINHVNHVYILAKKIVETLDLNVGQDELLVACYCHDMFSKIDRERHHIKAEEFIWDNRGELWFLKDLDTDVIIRIARAVAQHRASYTGEYSSVLSEVLSAADRGVLSTHDTIRRAFSYTMENNPEMKVQEALLNVWRHMKEKFSSKGYARYNDVYKNYFSDELEHFQKFMDYLKLEEVEYIIFMWVKNCRREDLNYIFSLKV